MPVKLPVDERLIEFAFDDGCADLLGLLGCQNHLKAEAGEEDDKKTNPVRARMSAS